MIYYALCINLHLMSLMDIDAQLMILMVSANIIRVINHYVYTLFFSPQRVEER